MSITFSKTVQLSQTPQGGGGIQSYDTWDDLQAVSPAEGTQAIALSQLWKRDATNGVWIPAWVYDKSPTFLDSFAGSENFATWRDADGDRSEDLQGDGAISSDGEYFACTTGASASDLATIRIEHGQSGVRHYGQAVCQVTTAPDVSYRTSNAFGCTNGSGNLYQLGHLHQQSGNNRVSLNQGYGVQELFVNHHGAREVTTAAGLVQYFMDGTDRVSALMWVNGILQATAADPTYTDGTSRWVLGNASTITVGGTKYKDFAAYYWT